MLDMKSESQAYSEYIDR